MAKWAAAAVTRGGLGDTLMMGILEADNREEALEKAKIYVGTRRMNEFDTLHLVEVLELPKEG